MIIDFVTAAFKNIFRKKFRSMLTIIGISIGVCSVVLIGSIGEIGTEILNKEIDTFGIGGLTVGVNSKSKEYLYFDDLEIIKSSEYVDNVVPILMEYTKSKCRNLSLEVALWGIGSGADQIFSLDILHGRLFNKSDIASSERVCIVDEEYAMKIYKRSNIVGKKLSVEINGIYNELEVVGVVKSGGMIMQNLVSNYVPTFIYTPYTTIQDIGGKNHFDQICVTLNSKYTDTSPDKSASISNSIIKLLEEKNNVQDVYKLENITEQKDQLNNILNIVTIILSIIAGISLIVAGLSIMTVMLVSVSERTREIGIKKSIGANKFDILFEFLLESFIMATIGSCIGLIVGIALSYISCRIVGIGFVINSGLTLFCILFSLIIGTVFGVYPAKKASELKPVDALRFE